MVTTMKVHENGELELPPRPRRRLRIRARLDRRNEALAPGVPTELGLSTIIA